jgi:hypothetical protein
MKNRRVNLWMAIVCVVVTATADSLCAQERTLLARIESAKATGSPTDDAKLAQEIYDMFVVAETSADANSLGSSLVELSSASSVAARLAAQAIEISPMGEGKRQTDALRKIVALRKIQYELSRSGSKSLAGEELIYSLLRLSDHLVESGAGEQSKPLLAEALSVADRIKSVGEPSIRELTQSSGARSKALQGLASVRASMAERPTDTALREKLLIALVVDMDSPDRAMRDLTPAMNESWRTYLPAATMPTDSLDAETAWELANWYAQWIAQASDLARPAMQQREAAALRQFLATAGAQDSRRKQAETRAAKTEPVSNKPSKGDTDNWALQGGLYRPSLSKAGKKASDNAVGYLLSTQQADGSWPAWEISDREKDRDTPTAWAVQALLAAGHSPESIPIRRAIWWMIQSSPQRTGALSERLAVWSKLHDPTRGMYQRIMKEDLLKLSRNCSRSGSFGPQGRVPGSGTVQATAAALRGMAWARQAGAVIPSSRIRHARRWLLGAQNSDNGWGSKASDGESSLNATVAALNGLLVSGAALGEPLDKVVGKPAFAEGVSRFDRDFANGRSKDPMRYYRQLSWLGRARGMGTFNKRNWYSWGSETLLKHQGPDGSWTPPGLPPHMAAALGVLFITGAP